MTRQEIINEINELMKPALELGFDWPSDENGFFDHNKATADELIDFLYEIELFIGNKEQEASE